MLNLKKKESTRLLNVYLDKLSFLPEKQMKYSELQRNITILQSNYSLIRNKLESAKINVAVQVGKVQVVDYARLPGKSGQNKNRMLLMGILLGLGAGVGLAFALEFLDNTIKSVDDVARNNLAVLGVIPSIGIPEKRKRGFLFRQNPFSSGSNSRGLKRRLMTREDPKSPVSEAYRSLRTSLLYSSSKKEPKTILISSAGPGEGKTTTVANLAITYANLGKKTLLVDTDLRRPVIHKVFDLNREPGITTFLSKATDDYKNLIQDTEINNLSIITAGIIPPNPSELLGSDRMTELVNQLENDWDMVLFDSPPLVAVTDATMISQEIDQIIMVVKVGQTDKKAFAHTLTNLRNVDAPLGGIIMNAVTHKSSYGSYYYYYYYQYYHYYGSDKESEYI
jgi:tyrosine-protein kinase Etk/Wzc